MITIDKLFLIADDHWFIDIQPTKWITDSEGAAAAFDNIHDEILCCYLLEIGDSLA